MTKDQLVRYITGGESESLELKENFSDSVIEALVAFANGKGGEILVGINNKLSVTGVTLSSESVQQLLKSHPMLMYTFSTTGLSLEIQVRCLMRSVWTGS